MAETINGFPIVAMFPTRKSVGYRPGRIVMVDRGDQFEERYVLSWQGVNDDGTWCRQWSCGTYVVTMKEARDEFVRRVQREILPDEKPVVDYAPAVDMMKAYAKATGGE